MRVYISHPLRGMHGGDAGHIRRNVEETAKICRKITEKFKEAVTPLSPVQAFSFLDPFSGEENELALVYCEDLLRLADEIWVFGDYHHSVGCRWEVNQALKYGLPVKFFDKADLFQ